MTKDLKNSILNRIESEKIQPRSKFYFFGKNLAFWAVFGLAVIIGAISFSVIVYALTHTDLEVGEFVEDGTLIAQWLTLLPLVWILMIGIAVGVGIVGLKNTKRGYRIALFTLIGSNILGSMLLGSGIYAAGGGEIIEEVIEEKVPFYEGARKKHQKFWGNPEETGRLAGRVESIDPANQTMIITDPTGRTWNVNYENEAKAEVGKPVKMRGRVTADGQFETKGVRPADRQKKMHDRIEAHFRKNPELRAKAESYLSPGTRAEMQELRIKKEPIPRELKEKIRAEIKANTTQEQRYELRPERPKRSEILQRGIEIRQRPPLDRTANPRLQ